MGRDPGDGHEARDGAELRRGGEERFDVVVGDVAAHRGRPGPRGAHHLQDALRAGVVAQVAQGES